MSDIADKAIREVVVRHDAFVAWFTGRGDDALMAETERAFAADMALISPDASIVRGEALIAMLRGARGSRPADFSIDVTDAQALWSTPDAALIAYVERQSLGGRTTARQSTALFTRDETAPGGVVWQHVHETWIDNGETP